ncbi:aldo/keto reductase, diketogulonate reductase [Sanguibacter keddieii DSM 10542]|uniref:Aldo/keto reductase, diketogulonate reductase n=1 Tax=Sanguibacter keddieii (strain ATCC 51767 / DSM 10542 / NCFB 3025 / ST-74) TaxID=446469 RepID=D1BJG7_SANKS|nr:aldo/keto reductase [Sanguibacter keddieii]ACZ20223.1 aldo/keto reductase, diketogulonate reductase [Sanguibacter keddieii DSM 10542]
MTQIPDITLNNGVTIPQLGFGTFQVAEDQTQRIVESAIETGYRHIDTAAGYYNEAGVGAAVRASGLAREDVFVTTKLRNGDQGYDNALAAFEASRAALDIDYVDLYLVHWPVPSKGQYVETWKAFEKLLADGAVRAIGVSNFLPEHLETLLAETDVVPAVNQIEVHPTFQQRKLVEVSRAAGIAIEAYSPLGRGADLESDEVTSIAAAHGVTPAQVVIRWHLQQDHIVIPKSNNPERIAANLDVLGFQLTVDEIEQISSLEAGNRTGADPATAEFTQFR